MKVSCIYKIEWTKCNYYYIGQSHNFKKRKIAHFFKLRHNLHPNKKLQNVFNKYGEPEINVLEYCSIDDLDNKEQFYLDTCIKNKYCCNHRTQVTSNRGIKFSEETRAKLRLRITSEHTKRILSEMFSGEKHPNWGKKFKKTTIQKMSAAKVGGKCHKAKKVIDTSTNEIFDCAKDAASKRNIKYRTLIHWLMGDRTNKSTLQYL